MEESLQIILGPPPEGWQKELFETYQKYKKSGKPHYEGDWETYEREISEELFNNDVESSSISGLYTELFGSPVKIIDYTFGMGMNRGLWVANITIPRSKVLVQDISITWPPDKEKNDLVASTLGYALIRDWIGIFSLYP